MMDEKSREDLGVQSDDEKAQTEGIREKLVQRKQEWAAAGRLLTGRTSSREVDRLPPGQRLVKT